VSRLRDRPTVDLIFLIFALTVCFVVVLAATAMVYTAIWAPQVNRAALVTRVTAMVNTMIGAIIGYAAGSSRPANPTPSEHPDQPGADENPPE
jgi:high-affinity K+ transport system ATPase subunit B